MKIINTYLVIKGFEICKVYEVETCAGLKKYYIDNRHPGMGIYEITKGEFIEMYDKC
jgi:hypothetical protein